MVTRPLWSQGLESLSSKGQLELLDTIDDLRSRGVDHDISLPQIIVCGDQSSGKSSVLEAISGVSFPVKSNTSTRFPTELILRKTSEESVKISIVPHHQRDESEKLELASFQEKLESFDEVPALIEKVKEAIGIRTMGKAFSKDLLRIEISGPDRPHLTIVDLPGLIHSESKHQSAADVALVTEVVTTYMKEPRSIILAVISAKNDYANQIVLSLARRVDPTSRRTLGVITKPDTLIPGSSSEKVYIALASNAEVHFRLGWHVLRNRDTDDPEAQTLHQRDMQEKAFFSDGSWARLPHSQLGVGTLRDRLSRVLRHQIATELPSLIDEISKKLANSEQQLLKLGTPRTNANEQRLYLMQISQDFQVLVQAAVHGAYTHAFFGDAMSQAGSEKRMRAAAQNINKLFADDLDRNGHLFEIVEADEATAQDESRAIQRDEYIAKVNTLITRNAGRELPGMYNPMIVSDIFREQSSPWEEIGKAHVRAAWEAAGKFLTHLIRHIADVTTSESLMLNIVQPKLAEMLSFLESELGRLLTSLKDGHPITYDQSLIDTMQSIKQKRQQPSIKDLLRQRFGISEGVDCHLCPTNAQIERFQASLMSLNSKNSAASDALDYSTAYYQIARKRFVDDVSVQVIEECLMSKLIGILLPLDVAMLTDDELERVAGETEGNKEMRKNLKERIGMLKTGAVICERFKGYRIGDLVASENEVALAAESEVAVENDTPDTSADENISKAPGIEVEEPIEELPAEVNDSSREEEPVGISPTFTDTDNDSYLPPVARTKKSKKVRKSAQE